MAGYFIDPNGNTLTVAAGLSANVYTLTVVAGVAFQPFAAWQYADTSATPLDASPFIFDPGATVLFLSATDTGIPGTNVGHDFGAGAGVAALANTFVQTASFSIPSNKTFVLGGSDGIDNQNVAQVSLTALADIFAITAGDASHLEGNSGTTHFLYTVTRTGDTSAAQNIGYAVTGTGGNPAPGSEFNGGALPSGTAHFAAGSATATIDIKVAGNSTFGPDYDFQVALQNAPANTGIGTLDSHGIFHAAASTYISTILNDDWQAAISPTATPSQYEGNLGTTTKYFFDVTRSGYTTAAGDVSWSLSTSAPGSEFAATSGTVHFAAGATIGQVEVDVVGNNHVQPDYNFTVNLSAAANSGGSITTGSASATILNDDAGFSIDNPSITEGDSGTQYITFTITRSGYLTNPDTIHWNFQNDAYVPVDTTDFPSQLYAADTPNPPAVKDGYPIFGTLDGVAGSQVLRNTDAISFAAGETTHTLTFQVNGDTWLEANDRFHILLTNPSLGSEIIAGHGDGTGTIGNNDQAGTVGYKGPIMGTAGADNLTAPQQLNGYQFFGGPGNDTLLGYGYDNLVYGADGADSIYGGDGHSMVDGGAGSDQIRMHGYIDTVYGGTGDDSIFGTEGTAKIDGGWGDDNISFAGNSNLLLGNYGNDSIYGGDHNNTIYGGIGSDTISVVGWANQIWGDDGQLRRAGFTYADSINGGDHDNTVHGGFGDDTISFVGQRNVAFGEDNNDLITGGSGYSTLDGGAGNDTINTAGWGNSLEGGTGNDMVVELYSRGVAAFSFSGGAWHVKAGYNAGSDTLTNVETLRFAGGGADVNLTKILTTGGEMQGDQVGGSTLTGLAGNDTLTGFGYGNSIAGGAGADSIIGGAGNGTLDGGDGNDIITVGGNSNVITGGLGNDSITLTGGSNHNNRVDAGDGNNLVTGGVDVNTIIGGNGIDKVTVTGHNNTITTNGGADVIDAGNGGAIVNAGAGADIITIREHGNFVLAGADNDAIHVDDALGNRIDGGDGTDTVFYDFSAALAHVVGDHVFALLSGAHGTDTLLGVEKVQFVDALWSL